ncbi:MAG: DNA/RNA non-specific endonuclease [Bacteroidaceae bacterium]|nr:DNA/RNA non-specific endonuclease [Bacteroidaceae bacterium]
MKKYYLHLSLCLLAGLCITLTACNDDDDPDIAPTSNAQNANSNAGKGINGVTENPNTTNIKEVACRLEIPQLKGGDKNLFIVHTVPTYGVNYCMEYDCTVKAQRWSAFRWDASNAVINWQRSNWEKTEWEGDPFQEDPLIPAAYRTTLADHRSNGYDRGHILGSQDRMNSKDANEQTFYLSNIHPQANAFNAQGIWYELENRLRNTYNRNSFRDTLYVVKGGTIRDGEYTRAKGIPVPKYFFMALLRKKNSDKTQGGYAAIGFWMEHKANADKNFAQYAVSIKRLEELTGLDFFCNLPDNIEAQVESNLVLSVWGLK